MSRNNYRVWDSIDEKIRDVVQINYRDGLITANDGDSTVTDTFEMFELIQSTGQLDKDHNEIYEGDIFITDTEYGLYRMIMEFVCDEGYFGSFVGKIITEIEYDENYKTGMKVIGNRFENKELLEG